MLLGGSSCLSKGIQNKIYVLGYRLGCSGRGWGLCRGLEVRESGFFREETRAQCARRAESPGKWFCSSSQMQGCIWEVGSHIDRMIFKWFTNVNWDLIVLNGNNLFTAFYQGLLNAAWAKQDSVMDTAFILPPVLPSSLYILLLGKITLCTHSSEQGHLLFIWNLHKATSSH